METDTSAIIRLAQNCARCAYCKQEIAPDNQNYFSCKLEIHDFVTNEEAYSLVCGYFC